MILRSDRSIYSLSLIHVKKSKRARREVVRRRGIVVILEVSRAGNFGCAADSRILPWIRLHTTHVTHDRRTSYSHLVPVNIRDSEYINIEY